MMDLLDLFERHLRENPLKVQSFHPFYEEALNAMLQARAKRFRPLLLLSVVEASNPLLIPSALDVALALEIFHTYSLIHDDLPVMDDADLRRGEPTLHTRYDELTATLVGDALNTHAFLLISKAALSGDTKSKLVELLAHNGGVDGMVHGQIIDCYFENQKLGLEQLELLHRNKTAKLIAASLQMGAVIADLDQQIQERLYSFGLELGLLFQIQDDIIDALWTQEEAGKTTQSDSAKNSFVTLLGEQRAIQEADRYASKLQERLQDLPPKIHAALQSLLERYLYRHHNQKG
ncbi:MAG: geranyl transferase [Epsilonproteobacteria bacterium]|nr:geranyl transferase [Campylobacterota bacterium]NPA64690.1 polyprenyl synthetase family protein [Campylobacterota bacterium]